MNFPSSPQKAERPRRPESQRKLHKLYQTANCRHPLPSRRRTGLAKVCTQLQMQPGLPLRLPSPCHGHGRSASHPKAPTGSHRLYATLLGPWRSALLVPPPLRHPRGRAGPTSVTLSASARQGRPLACRWLARCAFPANSGKPANPRPENATVVGSQGRMPPISRGPDSLFSAFHLRIAPWNSPTGPQRPRTSPLNPPQTPALASTEGHVWVNMSADSSCLLVVHFRT